MLTSPVSREMRIKTAVRYHLTPVPMAIIKKKKQQVLVRMWRKRKPCYTVDGSVNWCNHCGKQYRASSKH